MERVSTIEGKRPLIIVAPHGCDDKNTDEVAEWLAGFTEGYAVINRGWKKATKVDWRNDKANCNNVPHCQEDIVRDEFLDPLRRYVLRIERSHPSVYLFIIHGVGNHIRKSIPDLDLIIGSGRGSQYSSYSCDEWRKDVMVALTLQTGLHVYEAVDNKYSGRGKNNLNQFYRRWENNPRVHSMQLEIVYELRKKKMTARATANILSTPINGLLSMKNAPKQPGLVGL